MEKLMETYVRACNLLGQRDFGGALEAFLWLHDNPVNHEPASEMFRRAYGFQAWGLLANVYPPAKEKMQELLAEKIALVDNKMSSKSIESDIGAMKRILASIEDSAPE